MPLIVKIKLHLRRQWPGWRKVTDITVIKSGALWRLARKILPPGIGVVIVIGPIRRGVVVLVGVGIRNSTIEPHEE